MKTAFLLICTIFFSLPNSIANTKKADPVETFWSWFKSNEKRLKKFEENPNKYLSELLAQAKKIKSGLAIELEPAKNGIINMTVSADGDKNLFSTVQNIIDKAPGITGWKFIAFRQRIATKQIKGMILKTKGYELDPNKMKFFPVADTDSLDIIIYSSDVTEQTYFQIAYSGLHLLDNILGEYDCVTKVRHFDFQNMPTKKEELEDLLPLLDLAAYVDKFHDTKK